MNQLSFIYALKNRPWGGRVGVLWYSLLQTALMSLGDKRASHPTDSYTTFTALFPSFLLMFSLRGNGRDKVPWLYLPWRLLGEIDSSSIVQRQSTPSDPVQIGMCNSDGLFDSLIYGACFSCPVRNVIRINTGTGWYRSHFNPNSLWEEVWGGDWWCMLRVGGLSLSCLIQHFENNVPLWSNTFLRIFKNREFLSKI